MSIISEKAGEIADLLRSDQPHWVRGAIDQVFIRGVRVWSNRQGNPELANNTFRLLALSGHKAFLEKGDTASAFQPHRNEQISKAVDAITAKPDEDNHIQKLGHIEHVYSVLQMLAHSKALQNQFASSETSPRTPVGALNAAINTAEAIDDRNFAHEALGTKFNIPITTHPTEVKSPNMIKALNPVISAFEEVAPHQQNGAEEKIENIVGALVNLFDQWENFDGKKTPGQELDDIIQPMINVRIASGIIHHDLSVAAENAALEGKDSPSPYTHQISEPSSWIGGDRDGNPNVTTDFAIECADRFRAEAINMINGLLDKSKNSAGLLDAARHDIDAIKTKLNGNEYSDHQILINEIVELRTHYSKQPHAFRSQLRDIASVIKNGGLQLAKVQHRQDSGVMQSIFNDMMADWKDETGTLYVELSDEAKTVEINQLLADPAELKRRFDQTKQDLIAAGKDKAVHADMMKLFEIIPTRPEAWDTFIMANACMTKGGQPIGAARDVMESLALLTATGADKMVKIIPLVESKASLQNAGATVRAMLESDVFKNHLAQHQFALCTMIALSDTTRQHGPGIMIYQEQAIVDVGLAILAHNKSAPKDQKISLETYFGGALDNMRGGGDQTSRYFTLARKIYAAAKDAGYEVAEISQLVGPRHLLTLQGRDVTSRTGNTVKNATIYVGEMFASVINYSRFLHHPQSNKPGDNILAECRKDFAGDQKFQPIADKLIRRYETGFHGFFNYMADQIAPWELVAGITIANRGIARNLSKKPKETDSRAITMQNAEHLMGQDKAGWFGLRALKDLPFAERRELLSGSRVMQTILVKGLQSLARVDFEASWILAGLEKPALLDLNKPFKPDTETEAEYAAKKAAGEQYNRQISALDETFETAAAAGEEWNIQSALKTVLGANASEQDKTRLSLLWLEEEYRATVAVVNETLLGTPDARYMSAQDALKQINGRLSYEVADIEQTTHTARHITAKLYRQMMQEGSDINSSTGQAALTWAQTTFDASSTPTSLVMPGYNPMVEPTVHENASALASGDKNTMGIGNPLIHLWNRKGIQSQSGKGFVLAA